ncbi:MAG: hypothetical protein V4510_08240 [bacterium]
MNASRLAATATIMLFVLPAAVADDPETLDQAVVDVVTAAINAINATACNPPAPPPGDACGLTADAAATWDCLRDVVRNWAEILPATPANPVGDLTKCTPRVGVLCLQFKANTGGVLPGLSPFFPVSIHTGGQMKGNPFLVHFPAGPNDEPPSLTKLPTPGQYRLGLGTSPDSTEC